MADKQPARGVTCKVYATRQWVFAIIECSRTSFFLREQRVSRGILFVYIWLLCLVAHA
jgi:hypothetical protein